MTTEQEKQMEAELTEAGMKFDGHVTIGSFQEQLKVFKKYLALELELQALIALPDDKIDTSDIPEVTDWSKAVRGKFYKLP